MVLRQRSQLGGVEERRLRALLNEGRRLAQQRGRPVLVSAVESVPFDDPLAGFARGANLAGDRVLWSTPNADTTLVGVGTAWTFSASGSERFTAAAAAWRELTRGALVDSVTAIRGTGPTALAGFAFDPARSTTDLWAGYPHALLNLPRFTITTTAQGAWLTVNAVVSPDGDDTLAAEEIWRAREQLFAGASPLGFETVTDFGAEDPALAGTWQATVGSVVARIQRGEVEKVVLARGRRVQRRERFDPSRVLQRLRADYPGCFLFAFDRGDSCFLGATPEQLVTLQNGRVRTVCLAGSTARGGTPLEDRRRGDELLASAKNRGEHAIVVRGITDTLTAAGVRLEPVGSPSLVKMANIQHLYTPIAGTIDANRTILDLLERLHPTPSVGGAPREAALQVIRDCEGLDRGWYAGAVGWLDARGEGEFAVAIRSALLRGSEAVAFAGCGIVGDSDPEAEYAESCLKLRPMLAALGQGGR